MTICNQSLPRVFVASTVSSETLVIRSTLTLFMVFHAAMFTLLKASSASASAGAGRFFTC